MPIGNESSACDSITISQPKNYGVTADSVSSKDMSGEEARSEAGSQELVKSETRSNKKDVRLGANPTPIRIPFNKPPCYRDAFNAAVDEAFTYGKFSGDGLITRKVSKFLSAQYGFERTLLTPSCTAALEMAALILELGPDDEVIVPAFTFVTSALSFALRGVKLVFADSEKDQPNVSVDDILKKVTDKTKCIIVVHYAACAVDVHRILKATNHSIPVVEDAAHAITAKDPKTGDYLGKAGCMATFSFHETKNVGIGEGGLLVVNDEDLWRKAQIIREKGTNRTDFAAGRVAFYTWVDLGSSYLMSEIDAAMLWATLQNVDEIQAARLAVWDAYDQRLNENFIFKKPDKDLVRANAHMYFLEFDSTAMRSEFSSFLKSKGILTATHYVPLDQSPFVADQRAKGLMTDDEPCLQALAWSNSLIRLPLFKDLSPEDLDNVIDAINEFSTEALRLVPAKEEHWEFIRILRNENSDCFTQTAEVTKEEHWDFMGKHSGTYRVALHNGEPVGFIGHINKDVRLATNMKGRGIAQFMFKAFEEEIGKLDVKVLLENKRSFGFFAKLGYIPEENALEAGQNPVPLRKA